jgi:hypothetical protein
MSAGRPEGVLTEFRLRRNVPRWNLIPVDRGGRPMSAGRPEGVTRWNPIPVDRKEAR